MKISSVIKTLILSGLLVSSSSLFADTQTDENITHNIKNDISKRSELKPVKIEVYTNDGIVELVGSVSLDRDASAIIEIAQSKDGVNDVDTSKLQVKNGKHPIEDTFITAKVKGEFIKAKLLGDEQITPIRIHVKTKNGVVYLTGKAKDQAQIDDAIRLAKKVKNVKYVESKIELQNKQ